MDETQPPLIALTAGGPHAWITINALRDRFGPFPVILEDGEPGGVFWRRRLRMLGPVTVAGQFGASFLMKLTKPLSRGRVPALISEYELQPEPLADQEVHRVRSVNSEAACSLIAAFRPKAIYVVGTRMIGPTTLASTDAPFINYHSGINPAYRGMYGGYHALANGEPEHFGTTLHLIDEGVDTGAVLYQAHMTPTKADNFHTYTWLMVAESREAVVKAMEDAIEGRLDPITVDLPSRQYFGPTLWSYLWAGIRRGVW